MQTLLTLIRRELATYFVSFTGYVIMAAATFLIGLGFYVLVQNLGSETSPMPVTEMFYSTFFFWLVLILASPVITMRLFALEKHSGTFETLMTTPVSDLQVVVAKFVAAMMFYVVMWLPMLGCLFLVHRYSSQEGLDWVTVGTTYLGVIMLGGVFLSLGCFASAITRSQTVAAMVTFVLGITLFALAWLAGQAPASNELHSQVLNYFALFQHITDFARGIVGTQPMIFYACLTGFFLFMTLRAVESRRWR